MTLLWLVAAAVVSVRPLKLVRFRRISLHDQSGPWTPSAASLGRPSCAVYFAVTLLSASMAQPVAAQISCATQPTATCTNGTLPRPTRSDLSGIPGLTGGTLYVGPNGRAHIPPDCPKPDVYLNLQDAIGCIAPGDRILVRPPGGANNYYQSAVLDFTGHASGTAAQWIAIAPDPIAGTVVFEGGGSTRGGEGIIQVVNAHYLAIGGFTVQNTTDNPVLAYGVNVAASDHVVVFDNTITGASGAGLVFSRGSRDVLAYLNHLRNNARLNAAGTYTTQGGGWPASSGTAPDGPFYCVSFQDNDISESYGECLDLLFVNGGEVTHNNIHDCLSANIFLDGSTNIAVHRNLSYTTTDLASFRRPNVGRAEGLLIAKEYNQAGRMWVNCSSSIINNIFDSNSIGIEYSGYGHVVPPSGVTLTDANYGRDTYGDLKIAHNSILSAGYQGVLGSGYGVRVGTSYATQDTPSGTNVLLNNFIYSPTQRYGIEVGASRLWTNPDATLAAYNFGELTQLANRPQPLSSGTPFAISDISPYRPKGPPEVGGGNPNTLTFTPRDYDFVDRSPAAPTVGAFERAAPNPCTSPCPAGGTYDGSNCFVLSAPSGTSAFVSGAGLFYTPIATPHCPMQGTSFDGSNCFVGTGPDITTSSAEGVVTTTLWPYVFSDNSMYFGTVVSSYFGCADGTECLSVYVSEGWSFWGCYQGTAPAGTAAFASGGSLYYTPAYSYSCPTGNATFDGAQCFVLSAPSGTTPFVSANALYYTPTCRP